MSYLAGPIMLSCFCFLVVFFFSFWQCMETQINQMSTNPNQEYYLQSVFWQVKCADFQLKNTTAFLKTVCVSVPSFMKENEQMFNWNPWPMKASVQTEHSRQRKRLLRRPVKHHIPDVRVDLPTGKVSGKDPEINNQWAYSPTDWHMSLRRPLSSNVIDIT